MFVENSNELEYSKKHWTIDLSDAIWNFPNMALEQVTIYSCGIWWNLLHKK